MIKLIKKMNRLLLQYNPDNSDVIWVDDKLNTNGEVTINKVFNFKSEDLFQQNVSENTTDENNTKIFILGNLKDEYYVIRADILNLKHDLYLYKDMLLNYKTFIAYRNISIFAKIDNLIEEPIVVGGKAEGAIPLEDFEYLLKIFPNSTELTLFAHARITRVLKDYFNTMSDAQQKLIFYYEKTGKKLITYNKSSLPPHDEIKDHILAPYEQQKFEYIRDEIKEMLQYPDIYKERDWQKKIVDFLLLIFPKYILALQKLHIKDFYSNPPNETDRYIDITLVDSNGNIDIVEIKRPFPRNILSSVKYRDNFIPKKELIGAIMQTEKYIFHLNKWGHFGEKEILEENHNELPDNFKIKITNPKGLIIFGRDNDFTDDQQWLDFEIIRRKYANLIDIITYDDLLRRLENMIYMFKHSAIKPTHGVTP